MTTGHMAPGQPAPVDRGSAPAGAAIATTAAVLLDQLREVHAATVAGAVPLVGRDYRLRIEGAITAMEAVLGLPPSLPCK